jgi:hypothetical protein
MTDFMTDYSSPFTGILQKKRIGRDGCLFNVPFDIVAAIKGVAHDESKNYQQYCYT